MEKPVLWTPEDGQLIGPQAWAAGLSATSGAGKCMGGHEGIATWMFGTDSKHIWDTSGCKPDSPNCAVESRA